MSRRKQKPKKALEAVAGNDVPEGIGPHEFQEAALMHAGNKPLAMFSDAVPATYDMPEADFAPDVAAGAVVRREETYHRPGNARPIRFVYFALNDETWRIDAMHRINTELFAEGRPATDDDEREIGRLLGYDEADIERYVERVREKNEGRKLGRRSGK